MTITCDTDLNDILSFESVDSIVSSAGSNVRNCTRPRMANVTREIGTDGIKNALIDNSNVMYTSGVEVKNAYATFHTSLCSLEKTIRTKANAKEVEELTELISALSKEISSLNTQYNHAVSQQMYCLEQNCSQEEIDDWTNAANRIQGKIDDYTAKKTAAETRLKKRESSPYYTATGDDEPDEDTDEQPSDSTEEPPTQEQPPAVEELSHEQRTEYKLTAGEMVMIDGKVYTVDLVAKDKNNNFYVYFVDAYNQIYMIGPDGQLTDTDYFHGQPYIQNEIDDRNLTGVFDAYSTSVETAGQLKLPPSDTFVQGPPPENAAMVYRNPSRVYVNYGEPNPSDVVHVTSSKQLHDAVLGENPAPVITIEATKLEDNQNIFQNFLNGGLDVEANSGTGQITLVYDASTGKYWPMDTNGGYEVDTHGDLTPEKLQNFTIEN